MSVWIILGGLHFKSNTYIKDTAKIEQSLNVNNDTGKGSFNLS